MRRPRYSGCLLKRGRVYHLQYTIDGVRYRESAQTSNKELAGQKLRDKISAARAGETPIKETTLAALAELYLKARAAYWKPKTAEWAEGIWKNYLEPEFGQRNPASILPSDIEMYVSKLKTEGVSDCYANRHLVVFRAILRFGVRNKALREVPEFPDHFDERPFVHTGHLDSWDFEMLVDNIEEPWLEAMVTAAFTFGFRKSELLYMRCNQIDLERGWITLPAGSTKNRLPRRVVLNPSGKLLKLLKSAVKDKQPEAYVFSRDKKGSIPVRDFRMSFDRAAKAAKIKTGSGPNGKLHFHDLRRSAITRMHSAGLSEMESMAVAGHLSVDVHRRYKILSEGAARAIAERIDK